MLHIELLFLPSYSPNLNLIERLWKFIKRDVLYGRHYDNFTEFRRAIDGCLDNIPTKHHPPTRHSHDPQFPTLQPSLIPHRVKNNQGPISLVARDDTFESSFAEKPFAWVNQAS